MNTNQEQARRLLKLYGAGSKEYLEAHRRVKLRTLEIARSRVIGIEAEVAAIEKKLDSIDHE